MRPSSTLKANLQFKVSKTDRRQGFLGFYYTRFGTHPYEFVYKLAAATLWPFANVEGSPEMKILKDFVKNCVKDENRRDIIKSSLRYDAPTRSFEFRVPLFRTTQLGDDGEPHPSFMAAARDHTRKGTGELLPTPLSFSASRVGGGRIITGAELSTFMAVNGHTRNCVATGIKHVEGEKDGNYLTLWVTFRIDQIEAEYLNNSPVNQIKLANFYPTLLDWVGSVMGQDGKMPVNITAITAIAADVRKTIATPNVVVRPRVGVDNMVMDINNNVYVIPELDKASEYEQKLMDFGLRDNGVYTWAAADLPEMDVSEGVNVRELAPRPKLPTNMPIFTDWVNDKFAYSNSAGNLSVYDLSNTVPVSNYHLSKILNELMDDETKGAFKIINNAVTAAMRYDRTLLQQPMTPDEVRTLVEANPTRPAQTIIDDATHRPSLDFKAAFHKAMSLQLNLGNRGDLFSTNKGDFARLYQFHPETGLPALRWFGRALKKTLEMLETNQEAMFAVYSVMNVLQQLAVLRILINHGSRTEEISAADAAERDVYKNQGVDPEHEIEPLPLFRGDTKFMPHQVKVDNMLRKHPKSAVYAVDAGGGKTVLILSNVIREIKAGVCKKPIIMCPTHLVSQYIEDVVYFTEGRLNLIPCTNVTMKAHGEEALAKMIHHAPPNTIVVADYEFIKTRGIELAYGNKPVNVFRNAEFLRQFEFDLVALDESHFLKNTKSSRRNAVARLIQDIPYKRLASGTFVADTPKDVVSQIALIDPTVFGSEDNFKEEFGDQVRGGKVLSWKVGYEAQVAARIREHVVYAEAKRKEWAALLPDSVEKFYAVQLTENQRLLYDSILEETIELINEALAKNPSLKEAMEQEDDTKAEELESLLRPYMARLERFLSAPDKDPAGAIFLKLPEDHVSPKLSKMYELIQDHIDQGIPGKVLVFTQYLPTAEAAFLNAPPELRDVGIHYVAENKLQARSDFESNESKRWMVGQSSSMDTGLNFQHVSRLIRLETVWTPGVLEQGNSRINRPQLKKDETRTKIYFDWIMINRTVDVTKISRLMSKIISKAKFDEHDNPAYQQLEPLDPTPITLESIAANNDFKKELVPYLEAYNEYQNIRDADYAAYREEQGDKIERVAVPSGGMLEGSKLMSRVPYVPGMNLYKAEDLGLIRYDHFVRQDIDTVDAEDVAEEEDKDETEEEDENGEGNNGQPLTPRQMVNKANRELRARERVLVKYKPVHTEYGDGEITSVGIKKVKVKLRNGKRVQLHKMRVFIITRDKTNNIDMRNELLKQIGEIPLDHPITVPVEPGKANKDKKVKRGAPEKEQVVEDTTPTVNIDFTIINDMLFLKYSAEDSNDPALPVLQNLGFRVSPEYKFALMPHYRTVLRLFRTWRDEGFTIDKETSTTFMHIYNLYKTKGKGALGQYGLATKLQFQNFYRAEIKPSASPTMLKVFPQIENGLLYVMMPTKGQTGNLRGARIPVQFVKWKDGGGASEVLCFVKSKDEGKEVLKKILAAGLKIGNLPELKTQYTNLRMTRKK